MAFIPHHQVEQVKKRLDQGLVNPVKLHVFVEPAPKLFVPGRQPAMNRETQQLLEEVAALSEKLEISVHDLTEQPGVAEQYGVDKAPAIVIERDSAKVPTRRDKANVKFYGFPGGYEFATLLESLIGVSSGASRVSPDVRERLKKIGQALHVQVFATPT